MYDLDKAPLELLTLTNPKVAKGEKLGWLTAILHFAPASLSGRDVCAYSSAGCRAACLNKSGHGGINLDADGLNPVQVARIRRTRYLASNREAFMVKLATEIAAHERKAIKNGLKCAVRLNGTSDLPWENLKCGKHANIMAMFPGITFYDYTKVPARIRRNVAKVPNYSLTFSLSEDNDAHALDAIKAGLNVAVAFMVAKGQPLPAEYMGQPVIDGDVSDLRFLDPSGSIVGLRAKGSRGKQDTSGFVRTV